MVTASFLQDPDFIRVLYIVAFALLHPRPAAAQPARAPRAAAT